MYSAADEVAKGHKTGKIMIKTKLSAMLGLVANLGVLMLGHTGLAQPLPPDRVAHILASPDRTAADRTNDLRRKPEHMLPFIGISTGIVAFDLSAAGDYTTELLARLIGPSGSD